MKILSKNRYVRWDERGYFVCVRHIEYVNRFGLKRIKERIIYQLSSDLVIANRTFGDALYLSSGLRIL